VIRFWLRIGGGNLDESEFWLRLEYRVCEEISGLKQKEHRRFWCDGFLPSWYDLAEPSPQISGRVWMGIGGGTAQEEWEFVLLLRGPIESRETISWSALLPAADRTRWLSMDVVAKRLIIEPGVAVPDSS
jgi:hypothetical protein